MNLDFRTKMFLTIIIATFSLTGNVAEAFPYIYLLFWLVPIVLLAINKKYKQCIIGVILYIFVYYIDNYLTPRLHGFIALMFLMMYGILSKFIPGFLMGCYTFTTTKVRDMIESLRRAHVPNAILISLGAMHRFMVSVSIDNRIIKEAMKMHNINYILLIKNPLEYMERKVVPLLMVSTKTADDVSVSAVTRGLAVNKKRTTLSTTHLKLIDYLLFLLGFVFIYFYYKSL